MVSLNYTQNRHMEYVRQIYIYEKSTFQLASVGLAQACPNNATHFVKVRQSAA